jgi:hypothetical protein
MPSASNTGNKGTLLQAITENRYRWLREATVLIEYAVLIAYVAYLWLTTPADAHTATAQFIGNLVFAQFLGFFVTVIIGTVLLERLNRLQLILVVLGYGGFGFWLLLDFTTSTAAAVVWIVSILVGLLGNWENAFGNALASMLWLMLAGFLSALVGSMAGIPEDALLSTNLATVAAWAMLYYAGMLLADGYAIRQTMQANQQSLT